jgi:hypothetical protein
MKWSCLLLLAAVAGGRTSLAAEVPKQVLAFYYPWYASQEFSGRWSHWEDVRPAEKWIGSSTHYPEIGAYDSADPAVIDRHMRQMADCGVDGVIVSWWGRRADHDNRALETILDAAARHRLVVTVYYETIPSRDELEERAAEDLSYIVKRFAGHPAWQKVDGRPVIFLYARVVGEMGRFDRWSRVRNLVREQTGLAPFLVGDHISADALEAFDAVHEYNPVGALAGKSIDDVRRAYHLAVIQSETLARESGKPVAVTLIPGYDDTKIRKPGLACSRHDGQTLRAGWDSVAGRSVRWVLITSWNEWHEGSEIEPSAENGDRELGAMREGTTRFKDPRAQPVAVPVSPGWRPFVETWQGGTIGILGSPGTVAGDVATSGLPFRFVSLKSFATGKATAADCPMMFYTGGEDVSTNFGDGAHLVPTIGAYREQGGVIVFASSGPWPMHRDLETGRTAFSREVGLPITVGFEEPPAEGMYFEFEGDLAEFQRQPFPVEGDQRFRPCGGPGSEALEIVPLATLHGADGTPYGPAIAVIRSAAQRSSAPMLYVWFRMWDVVDREKLLKHVLEKAVSLRATGS